MARSDSFKWYPRTPTKMMRGVRGLGAAVIGCYNVVLDLIYEDEGSCPDDPAFIGGILGESTRQTRALIQRLVDAGKLVRDGNRLRNEKAEEVIKVRASSHKKAVESGAKGGRSRVARGSADNENNNLGQATLKHLEENRIEKKKDKATPTASPAKNRSAVPDDFPHKEAKAAAIKFWRDRNRPDLAARIEDEVEKFRDHHIGHGKRMADWAAAWRTWIKNALDFNKPGQDLFGGRQTNVVPLENIKIDGWVTRLEHFYLGDVESDLKPGFWQPKYGAEPGKADCKVPAEAIRTFEARHGTIKNRGSG